MCKFSSHIDITVPHYKEHAVIENIQEFVTECIDDLPSPSNVHAKL